MTRKQITLERTFEATLQDVWDLWTTKDGIESWWGPEGFTVTVQRLELRAGGQLQYTMTATAPAQVAFMKQAGMPLAQACTIRYVEIEPKRRLAYVNLVDFVPGVAAYDVATIVELQASGSKVHMVVSLDPMHDEEWTRRATMGWESELGKLARVIDERRQR